MVITIKENIEPEERKPIVLRTFTSLENFVKRVIDWHEIYHKSIPEYFVSLTNGGHYVEENYFYDFVEDTSLLSLSDIKGLKYVLKRDKSFPSGVVPYHDIMSSVIKYLIDMERKRKDQNYVRLNIELLIKAKIENVHVTKVLARTNMNHTNISQLIRNDLGIYDLDVILMVPSIKTNSKFIQYMTVLGEESLQDHLINGGLRQEPPSYRVKFCIKTPLVKANIEA